MVDAYARAITPDGGDTEFADTRAAYDALPEEMKKRLEGLIAEHSLSPALAKASGYIPTEEDSKVYPLPPATVARALLARGPMAIRSASAALARMC